MTAKDAYEQYREAPLSRLLDSALASVLLRHDEKGRMLFDLWQAVKHEAAPLDAERVQARLKELAEWFDNAGVSPGISIKLTDHINRISAYRSAGYLLREITAQLESAMAEQRHAEKGERS